MPVPCTTAVIYGTGFNRVFGALDGRDIVQDTPLGPVPMRHVTIGGTPLLALPRHGRDHGFAPHQVPYRAHTAALVRAGVRRVIATNAVGALRADLARGALLMADDFIDFTRARDLTYFGGPLAAPGGGVCHTDLSVPYCPDLRRALAQAAQAQGVTLATRCTYVCTDGPRYESPAEVRMMAQWGGDVVGMTGVPEVVFAREAGLCYAAVCVVTNPGAGLSAEPIAAHEVTDAVQACAETVVRVMAAAAAAPAGACACVSRDGLR